MDNKEENKQDGNQDQSPQITLTKCQEDIFKTIEEKRTDDFKSLIQEHPNENLDFIDENKMTPLQHACYRGSKDVVKILIDKGVDVNKCEHDNEYTSLHFAALSGNIDVCHMLLAAGVNTHTLNSVNRTAAQMASFIGNHGVVSTINNFIPKSDIDYFTVPHGQQKSGLINKDLGESIYKFALLYNLNPIKIAMLFQSYNGLVDNWETVKKIFELLSEKEMKRKEMNEVLSFKFFYISAVISELGKVIKIRKEQNANEDKSFVEIFSKKLLKPNKRGVQEGMDMFIKERIRGFPYTESNLFQQIVMSLAKDSPTAAVNIVSAAVNGQGPFMNEKSKCTTCGEEEALKKCAKCKNVSYCDRECQRLHWFVHKKECDRLGKETTEIKKPDTKEITQDMQSLLINS